MKGIFNRFFASEVTGGWLLLTCIVASLVLANSPLAAPFARLLATEAGVDLPGISLRHTLPDWISDGLMAVFFLLVVGPELRPAFLAGGLATFKKASLPVLAARLPQAVGPSP